MSKLHFFACVVGLAFSVRADAATLTVFTDRPVYLPGETVTIAAVGNSGGGTAHGMFASLAYDPAALLDPDLTRFTPTTGTANAWFPGVLGCDTTEGPGHCWLLNHISFELLGLDPIEQTLAILTATAGAPGLYNINWSSAPGNELYFFGAPSGPGANLLILNASFQVIPEPATALLLGIGLIGLAFRRRRLA
jgi:hypothetical protein